MPSSRKVLVFESSFLLTNHLVRMWVDIARESIERDRLFTAALSGGRSPGEFYTKLASLEDFDYWHKTHIFLTDERFVPADDEANNLRLLKKHFLDYVNIPAENIHPIRTDLETCGLAAEHYKNMLRSFFEYQSQPIPRFDLMFLGLGEDGHVASLFPHQEGIDDANRLTTPTSFDFLEQDRISLALSVINNARHIVVLANGKNKASIISGVLKEKKDIPATKVFPIDGDITYLLDKEAASQLTIEDNFIHQGHAISLDI